jgi:transposase
MTIVDLVPDQLWNAIQPLLPPEPPKAQGRPTPRAGPGSARRDRLHAARWPALAAAVARELGAGSPTTCWRRLRDRQAAGVWQQLHAALLDELGRAEGIDWSRVCLDSLSVRAKRGGELTGPNPTDRGKPGSKYHLVGNRHGVPLVAGLSAANTHDAHLLEAMVDAIPPVKGPPGGPGRPRKRPAKLHGDKAYDSARCRRALRRRGIMPRIARRGIEPSQKLGRYRWVVERSLAWLVGHRRLGVRTSGAPTCSKHSCTWPARWSACASSSMPAIRHSERRQHEVEG